MSSHLFMPLRGAGLVLGALLLALDAQAQAPTPVQEVNPFIGTTNGGNVFPGPVAPFGMVSFSPDQSPLPGRRAPIAAPGGYEWRSNGIRGFSLTHLSGSGCAGAGGDIPLMPITTPVRISPSSPDAYTAYSSLMSHAKESASPGAYRVAMENGVTVELAATPRTAVGRFSFPADKPANVLFRTSDSQTGSTAAVTRISPDKRTVSGSVTSGNFCGYLATDRRESYYTLHFVAVFDQPFTTGGTWRDGVVTPGSTSTEGGTTYGEQGFPPAGKGSGGWISFEPKTAPVVNVRIGVSYVDEAGALANLEAESPVSATLEGTQGATRDAWNQLLGKVRIEGGSRDDRTVFYTALYHSLIHPSLHSDVDGRYLGMDGRIHEVSGAQKAQYANFSGWDVYRSQVQLVTLLEPKVGSDLAQSLLNQARQNGGVWDRWTHVTGATGVMNGDPSPPTVAAIHAFGGRDFDLKGAYASLLKAATVPTPKDLGRVGCPVLCQGQRPGLDQWLSHHYMPVGSPGWGSASDTLELAAADFAMAQLARLAGDKTNVRRFTERSGWWRNLYNPAATSAGGYIQPRNADGSWPAFDPASDDEFVEGSGAHYLWMVPFDPAGLFELMGGRDKARARLDGFFQDEKGEWVVTKAGPLHAELDNEPSIAAPWLYLFAGEPWKTQAVVRAAMRKIWTHAPEGISGNDDLGQMSSWYVWSALGLYPVYPGRAELVVGSPLFTSARISRPGATLTIKGTGAAPNAPYVRSLKVNGKPSQRAWLPADFIARDGVLEFELSPTPDRGWGAAPADAPPSFGPRSTR
ncbi:Alpha-1,2-mannosidase [Cystobacter fuscus DSM 2262]|uniref:Alpha-1,2-mannosidase n=1 Tax=Cystobacter fuscus (strain ATCC 25194 / DSM 2262 / NBRC 100088 / M29) TaxID=1242864 RepID=S9QF09_CYSF2|nr:GH92 family glycosyl hydrolase [Cystobacter fuscus]EPX59919.1 Alpha-1,2-mannosidase [Cystobacter fuscus DSM 2262]